MSSPSSSVTISMAMEFSKPMGYEPPHCVWGVCGTQQP